MNKFSDDIFQLFLEFNDDKEIVSILAILDNNKMYDEYRLNKYTYYVLEKIRGERIKKLIERESKKVGKYLDINYENINGNFFASVDSDTDKEEYTSNLLNLLNFSDNIIKLNN